MTRIDFDTSLYHASHGKGPRGRGSWAFGTSRNADARSDAECWWSPGGLTISEAKKWAKAEAARRFGPDARGTLWVMP